MWYIISFLFGGALFALVLAYGNTLLINQWIKEGGFEWGGYWYKIK